MALEFRRWKSLTSEVNLGDCIRLTYIHKKTKYLQNSLQILKHFDVP